MAINLPKTVPLLPGHTFQHHLGENHHKTQQLSLVNGVPQEKTNYISEADDPNLIDQLRMKTPPSLTYGSRQRPANDFIPRIQPPWLKYDRQVLRFFCYFQEAVVENPVENYRVRKCTIYYYLSDGTIHVNEPKSENSGITQGLFIKRQKIPKKLNDTSQYYTWEDLNVGININFYERVFRIVGADDFTKEFYQYMGVALGGQETMPTDSYDTFKLLKDIKVPPPDQKEYKEYVEVNNRGGHPNGGLQKYLQNDRKVLSFNVFWDDQTLEGGINYYVLNYFLSDDTIEVKEVRKQNSGRDPFPLMLNRKKLPKIPLITHYPGMTMKKEEFYGPQDLQTGNQIIIYGKACNIYDADEFTKDWYRSNFGIDLQAVELASFKGKKFHNPVPPYNGYGSPEDSLGSVYALQPKPPKKDINKMYTQDQYILRFEARLISKAKDDNTRTFIVSFFCGDDTIQVYEVADKNSGLWRGKFLERSRHSNPTTQQYFKEKDFQIGETLQFSVYKFQLLKADEFTHKYMKSKPEVFREADINHVLDRIRQLASKYNSLEEFLIELVRSLDTTGTGTIDFDQLSVGLKNLGFNLTYQELYTLMRYFDKDWKWRVDVKELFVGLGGSR